MRALLYYMLCTFSVTDFERLFYIYKYVCLFGLLLHASTRVTREAEELRFLFYFSWRKNKVMFYNVTGIWLLWADSWNYMLKQKIPSYVYLFLRYWPSKWYDKINKKKLYLILLSITKQNINKTSLVFLQYYLRSYYKRITITRRTFGIKRVEG